MITNRQATINDLPALVPIFDKYRQHFGQAPDPERTHKFLFDRFEHLESVIFVAEVENSVIGFAQLYPVFSSLSLQRVWLLNDFYILEDMRDKGIGKQLFETVKQYCILTKAKGIELSVQHTNRAWKFWEEQDFVIDDEFRYYFLKL
jgi:GNAT superfamily N-acetyltransferase